MSGTITRLSSNVMTHYGLAEPFLSLNHSAIMKIAVHTMNAKLFPKRKLCERVLNLRSTPNAQAARILAPVYILIVNVRSQTPLFHLLIESSRFTLTSLWIILRSPGENVFLEQSSSCGWVTNLLFLGLCTSSSLLEKSRMQNGEKRSRKSEIRLPPKTILSRHPRNSPPP